MPEVQPYPQLSQLVWSDVLWCSFFVLGDNLKKRWLHNESLIFHSYKHGCYPSFPEHFNQMDGEIHTNNTLHKNRAQLCPEQVYAPCVWKNVSLDKHMIIPRELNELLFHCSLTKNEWPDGGDVTHWSPWSQHSLQREQSSVLWVRHVQVSFKDFKVSFHKTYFRVVYEYPMYLEDRKLHCSSNTNLVLTVNWKETGSPPWPIIISISICLFMKSK